MADVPNWPRYLTGSKDSIFALGVVSTNYARFEFAVYGMFSTLLGISADLGARLINKVTPEMRDKLMREALPTNNWSEQVTELAQHFIIAHKTIYENRNKLMHSAVVPHKDAIILYKTGRDGKTTAVNPTLAELRRVADETMLYYEFGMHLSNMISWNLRGGTPLPGDFAYGAWPDKPPLPIPLEYTSDPTPIRAQR